ncbi:MAG TPA: DUF4007 family protein [Methylotenera sp.]|nr:DUF4007 family protein [Methylotenera sp.]
MSSPKSPEKFTGHESFTCRYGWFPKVYNAIDLNPFILKDDHQATIALGIGKNMVKSLQFWAEAAGVISNNRQNGHTVGQLGRYLLSENGKDPYLENTSSMWLIHWNITTKANLAAWNIVFGEALLSRFDKSTLESILLQRGDNVDKSLATSTVEQHASIFINSYFQEGRANDDSLWCPLQDLDLLRSTKTDNGRIQYFTKANLLSSLSEETFAIILIDYLRMKKSNTVDFNELLNGKFSPGLVLKLDEYHLRKIIEQTTSNRLKKALRFIDTADTQTITLDFDYIDSDLLLITPESAVLND